MPLTQNEFPQPANARPPVAPTAGPEPPAATTFPAHGLAGDNLRRLAGQEVFRLDPDLRLALEDMCQAAEGSRWRERWVEWLSRMVNDSLKNYLGQ